MIKPTVYVTGNYEAVRIFRRKHYDEVTTIHIKEIDDIVGVSRVNPIITLYGSDLQLEADLVADGYDLVTFDN